MVRPAGGPSATFGAWAASQCWHPEAAPSSARCSTPDLPIAVVLADRPCGALGIAERGRGRRPNWSNAPRFGADFDRVAYTHEVLDALARHRVDLIAMAGFGTILSKPIHDAYPDRSSTPIPRCCRRSRAGTRSTTRSPPGVKVTGCTVHLARLEVDEGPILAQEAVPVLPDDTVESLHERIKEVERRIYPEVLRALIADEDASGRGLMRTKITRALLSVYDKTGIVEFARELQRARRRAGVVGRHRHGDRRGRHPGDRGRRHHRRPAHPRPPGRHAAPEDPRRDPGRPLEGVARRRHGHLRHPAVRPRGLEPLPVRAGPRHRDHRRRRPGDGAGGGEEPRVRHRRHRRVAVRAVARGARRQRQHGRRRHPPRARRRRVRQHRGVRRRRSSRGCSATTSCPQYIDLALERTGEALRYGENPHQHAARYRIAGTASWWDGVEQHAGLALSLPQPLRRRRRVAPRARPALHGRRRRPAVAIIKHANPCGVAVADDLATAYQRALECDERSAFGGIVALNRPVDAATVERMVAGPQADLVIAPGCEAGHHRRADREAQEHPPPRAPARRSRRPSTSARSAAGSWCRTPTTSPPPGTTGGSSPSARPPTPSGATPSWPGASAVT